MKRISALLKQSIRYALDHRARSVQYALQYARDMDVKLADQFVGMYVNDWTLDYGPRGRAAVGDCWTKPTGGDYSVDRECGVCR